MVLAHRRHISSSATLVFALVAALCCSTSSATDWTVGDSAGWTIPFNYTTWVAGKTFVVGDVLLFPYQQGSHTVVIVNQTQYDSCTFASSDPTFTTGNTIITLNNTGSSYYLCSIPQHCAAGMKLAVEVIAAGVPAPSPISPSPSATPVPSPGSMASPTPSPASSPTEAAPSPASTATPTPSPASTPTQAPTPSPASTTTPTPSPASTPTQAPPSPASTTTPTPSPASTPTQAPTPSPASTTTSPPAPPPSPTGAATPPAPASPPNSSPKRVQAAVGGVAILWTVLGSTILML